MEPSKADRGTTERITQSTGRDKSVILVLQFSIFFPISIFFPSADLIYWKENLCNSVWSWEILLELLILELKRYSVWVESTSVLVDRLCSSAPFACFIWVL